MSGLLDVAQVVRGDGHWSATPELFDSFGCAMQSVTVDICNDAGIVRTDLSGTSTDDFPSAYGATIFGVVVSLAGRLMCMGGDEPAVVRAAMDAEVEKAAGQELWAGLGGTADAYLESPDVSTTAGAGTDIADLGELVAAYWDRVVGVDVSQAILHLGISRLVSLFGPIENGMIKNLGMRVVTSPGYPATGMAITGPIIINLSEIQSLTGVDSHINRAVNEASQIVAIKFDPCLAVRVA